MGCGNFLAFHEESSGILSPGRMTSRFHCILVCTWLCRQWMIMLDRIFNSVIWCAHKKWTISVNHTSILCCSYFACELRWFVRSFNCKKMLPSSSDAQSCVRYCAVVCMSMMSIEVKLADSRLPLVASFWRRMLTMSTDHLPWCWWLNIIWC